MEIERRFLFAGHAIGAAAWFNRLGEARDLNHVIPTLGASVLPVTGGLSQSDVSHYCFTVDQPKTRSLLSVREIKSTALGRRTKGQYETEVETTVRSASVLNKLFVDFLELHLRSSSPDNEYTSYIRARGNRIEGLRLGGVTAKVELDEEPLDACGTKKEIAAFYANQNSGYRKEYHWRFNTPEGADEIAEYRGRYICSLVRKIELSGPEDELAKIRVDGYTIVWEDFGRIILGEVIVRDDDRRLTLIRLKMGSDAEGVGILADGHSNGGTMP